MNEFEKLDQLVEAGNGYLQTSNATGISISKYTLSEYVKKRNMKHVAHGIYLSEDGWPDEYYQIYLRNKRIVFSYESALYLYGLMDREPAVTTVTVPKGYNASHLSRQGIRVIHTKWFDLGVSEIQTNFGNSVPVYDRERTICDIIRNKKDIEIQTFQTAMKEYMSSRGKNLANLMQYAKTFHIEESVRTYTEVML